METEKDAAAITTIRNEQGKRSLNSKDSIKFCCSPFLFVASSFITLFIYYLPRNQSDVWEVASGTEMVWGKCTQD